MHMETTEEEKVGVGDEWCKKRKKSERKGSGRKSAR